VSNNLFNKTACQSKADHPRTGYTDTVFAHVTSTMTRSVASLGLVSPGKVRLPLVMPLVTR